MSDKSEELSVLEGILRYTFKDIKLLTNALVHRSYSFEAKDKPDSNERLEFMGDAVLQLCISEFLFKNFELSEGELSKLRAGIVSETPLADAARRLGIGKFLLLGHGADLGGIRDKNSVLADAFEAITAAIYLDGGMECAVRFIFDALKENIASSLGNNGIEDYKSALQEKHQRYGSVSIKYECYSESGKDHDKTFCVRVLLNGEPIGKGQGKTKKEAEQNAAKNALSKKD